MVVQRSVVLGGPSVRPVLWWRGFARVWGSFLLLGMIGGGAAWGPLALFLGSLFWSVRRFPMPPAAEDGHPGALAWWLCVAWVVPGAMLAALVWNGPLGMSLVGALALAWPRAARALVRDSEIALGLVAAMVPLLLSAQPATQSATPPSSAPTSAPSATPRLAEDSLPQPGSVPSSAPIDRVAPASQVASPPDSAPVETESPRVTVSGFVDVFASFNPNAPADRANFIDGTGTTAKRANEAGLNLAALLVSREAAPVGFTVALGVGQASEVVHAGEPAGVASGLDATRVLQQASLVVQAAPRLRLEAGLYPSHIGFEVYYSKDNWNYSRPWIGELSPYYAAGVKAAYQFSEHWSGQLHLVNGWQILGDNNEGKSLGTQLSYRGKKVSLWVNGFLGPELPGDNHSLRGLADVVLLFSLGEKSQAALSLDAAFQQRPGRSAAPWYAAAAWLRVPLGERSALALRGEVFRDAEGAISGTAQTLTGGTATVEFRPWDALILKLEGRYDVSTAASFHSADVDASGAVLGLRSQPLALVGAVVSF